MKRICLDIGNVLCAVDFSHFLRHLSCTLNITLDEAQYFLNRTQKLHDMGLTSVSDELRDHFKIKSPVIIDELLKLWMGIIWRDNIALEQLLEKHEVQVALLSNIGFEHAKMMEEWQAPGGVNPFFPKSIKHFSCYVGARKPSSLFYQSFLLDHPEFKGCLYVDDLQENLDTGSKFGFQPFRLSLEEDDISEKLKQVEEIITKTVST